MPPQATPSPVQELIDQIQAELEQAQREMREMKMMVTQSQGEVNKLAQRNATLTGQLRQIQANFDGASKTDIKTAYDGALDSQQRLFTMRGQLEKLQSDQATLERLTEHLTRTLEALQASGAARPASAGPADGKPAIVRVVEAQEAERQRLSKAIHDGPAQALSNFIIQSEIAMRLFEIDPERAKAELSNLKTAASSTFQRVREFIFDLRPMMLDDLGLAPTIKRYVDTFKDKSGIDTTLTVTGADRRIEGVREIMLFRAVQELLTNARNHAQASQIRITYDIDDARVRIGVEDNGKGFDVEAALNGKQKTIGLPTLKERIALMGGEVQIDSQPGHGTQVTMEVPAPSPEG